MPDVKPGQSEEDFMRIIKFCENCGIQLLLNKKRDIKRKRFCSKSCCGTFTAKKYNLRPPIRIRIPREKCKSCNQELSLENISGFCQYCFTRIAQKNGSYKQCLVCGKEIYSRKGYNKKFCGLKCNGKYHSLNKKKTINIKCSQCNKIMQKFQSLIKGKKNIFCSRKCQGLYGSENFIGEKAHYYLGGRTPYRKLIRHSTKYYEWRDKILRKVEYRCERCRRENYLHVHHKNQSFSKLLGLFLQDKSINKNNVVLKANKFEPFWDLDNGEATCIFCHSTNHPNLIRKEQYATAQF